MQIPKSLQHFPEPALIVTTDHVYARLWLAFEDSMEELEVLEMPQEEKSDHEGEFYNPDTGGVHATEPHTNDERLHKFIRVLAEHVSHLIRDDEAATSVHLIAPEDMMAALKKELAPEAANIVAKELPINVMKEDEVHILERIVSA
jgi:hypothetical protein